MELLSLAGIRSEIDYRAAVIGATDHLLPTYGRSEDFARPHIEVDARGYHYVVVERGQELERVTTSQLDELLYRVFQSITFSLSCEFELRHRMSRKDCRRLLFQHQRDLLASLSPDWAERCAQHHQEVLRENPFVDR